MIEVLVALFVLAIGMLGVLAMQSTSVQVTRNAALYSQAEIMLMDIYEAMRASPRASVDNFRRSYNQPIPNKPSCQTSGTPCSAEDLSNWSLNIWLTNLAQSLPGGQGEIVYNAVTDEYFIRVRFEIGYDEDTEEPITESRELVTVL